jgi:GT2 family glycosyltransferase
MGKNHQHPLISIIIPTLNNEIDIIDCLESIKAVDYPLEDLELIIWDNSSCEKSKTRVKEYLKHLETNIFANVAYIESPENLGVYTSRDELIKKASVSSEFILSIDDDVLLPQDIFTDLLSVFERDDKIGIVGPRTVYADVPSETAHGAGFINWWLGKYSDIDAKESVECDYVIGCCMLIKRSVIDNISGFDRDYYTSHGEIDFCMRAKKAGFRVIYYPKVIVKHRVDRGGTRTLNRMYYIFRNKLLFIRKNAPLLQKCVCLTLYSFLWFPKILLYSILMNKGVNKKELKVLLKAVFDGFTGKAGKQVIDE